MKMLMFVFWVVAGQIVCMAADRKEMEGNINGQRDSMKPQGFSCLYTNSSGNADMCGPK
jgi:hypothetical protein